MKLSLFLLGGAPGGAGGAPGGVTNGALVANPSQGKRNLLCRLCDFMAYIRRNLLKQDVQLCTLYFLCRKPTIHYFVKLDVKLG